MDLIVSNLYLGNIEAASNINLLKRSGVTHVLQVAAGFQPFFPGVTAYGLKSFKEFKYKVVNVLDMPFENLARHFPGCLEFIRTAISSGGTVLVHW
jgi:hypothetical protein